MILDPLVLRSTFHVRCSGEHFPNSAGLGMTVFVRAPVDNQGPTAKKSGGGGRR